MSLRSATLDKALNNLHRAMSRSLQNFTKSEKRKEIKMSNSDQEKAYDKRIGALVRDIRIAAGMSQNALASALGISHQQISKHEAGLNRISAGRIKLIAEILCMPVSTFFETVDVTKDRNLVQAEKCRKEAEDLLGQIMALETKERISNGNADHSACYAQIRQKLQNLSSAFEDTQEGN